MVQVMDLSHASDPNQLLTELRSRFPELPIDLIKTIMFQVRFLCQPELLKLVICV